MQMKTKLKAILNRNVGVWPFVLTCVLLATVLVTAKVLADEVANVHINSIYNAKIDVD